MVDIGKGFPKKMCMTHKYVEVASLTSTTGVMGKYLFACNNMYDPNYTITGHQPLYRDQCAALYQHYCVIGSKIKVKAINAASNTGLIGVALFINDDTTTTPTTLDAIVEQTNAKSMKIIPYNSSDPVILGAGWSARKWFGKSPLANNSLGAAYNSSPAEQCYYTLCVQCMDGASTVGIYFDVEIEYICIWTELNDIGQS